MGEIVPSSGQARKEFLLNPADIRLMKDSYLPDGYGPVTGHLRYVEDLPHEGCLENRTQLEDSGLLNLQGAWDPCTSIPLSNDFRITMPYYNDGGGFMLVSRPLTSLPDIVAFPSEEPSRDHCEYKADRQDQEPILKADRVGLRVNDLSQVI